MRLVRLVCAALLSAAAALPCRADDAYALLQLNGHPVKWGTPEFGTGATITYNFATSASRGGEVNCRDISGMSALLRRSHIRRHDFERAVDGALHAWEAAANVRFLRVADGAAAGLTISAERIADGIAYTDVTPTSSTTSAFSTPSRAVICLNPKVTWSTTQRTGTKVLGYVLKHEVGHALGLDHPGPTGELMSFEYSDTIENLQPGDIAGIRFIYGPARRTGKVALNVATPP